MGIIVGLLVSTQALFADADRVAPPPLRPDGGPDPALGRDGRLHRPSALGTALGGWRIVKTMGTRITKLRPFGGFCAETAGGITVLIASALGVPVSTTHTITGAIVGRRGGPAALGGALGRGDADRLGLDSHHADGRGDRRAVLPASCGS